MIVRIAKAVNNMSWLARLTGSGSIAGSSGRWAITATAAVGMAALMAPAQFAAAQTRPATSTKASDPNLNTLTAAEKAAGWELLFDGDSTEHFRKYRATSYPTAGWEIDDNAIQVVGGGGDIITRQQYTDFELAFDYKCSPNANSGVMYHVSEQHSYPWQTGPEFQIVDDAGPSWNYGPDHVHATGSNYDIYGASAAKKLNPPGEYNTARILVRDGHVKHFLNGEKVLEYSITSDTWKQDIANSKFSGYDGFGLQGKGHICFQDHGDKVWFRNIKVRDLTMPMPGEMKLFNGRDTDGWNTFFVNDAAGDDTFVADNGVLVCKGQPIGYIQSNDTYTNYVLKLQWRFDPAKGAGNSGVLLRKIEEDKVWPRSVEAQLHSGNAGDFWNIGEFPMKTVDSRTRGRNTKKRHDGAEKPLGEWNEYEIVVDGGEITLYVNGEKLNHAWDVKETPGTICLQSEGAAIHFRNIRLAPIK